MDFGCLGVAGRGGVSHQAFTWPLNKYWGLTRFLRTHSLYTKYGSHRWEACWMLGCLFWQHRCPCFESYRISQTLLTRHLWPDGKKESLSLWRVLYCTCTWRGHRALAAEPSDSAITRQMEQTTSQNKPGVWPRPLNNYTQTPKRTTRK